MGETLRGVVEWWSGGVVEWWSFGTLFPCKYTSRHSLGLLSHAISVSLAHGVFLARYLTLRLPFGPAPTEAAIGGYSHEHLVRALHRVYSVGATIGCEKRCYHRYETGGEPSPSRVVSSCQLSPHWHEASGSET